VDDRRGKLLDYWAIRQADGLCTEEEMELEMDRLAQMGRRQLDSEYWRLMSSSSADTYEDEGWQDCHFGG
jgi:hypothetical protein